MSISRRNILKSFAVTSTLAVTGCSVESGVIKDKKLKTKNPNLLIILPDEMRLFALEFMKEDPSITPNLNKFQKESCLFRQNVSNFPLCTPFRGMLMTGQYPYRNGLQGNSHTGTPNHFGGRDFGIYLKKEALTWADLLKEQGYSLGYIGKWHLDAPKPPFVPSYNNPLGGRYWNDWTAPEDRHGFDYWYSYGTNDLHLTPMYWTNDTPRDRPIYINQWSPEHEADKAIEYLRNKEGKYRDNNQPFALVVSMNPPHSPYDQVPQKYLDRITKTSEELNLRPNVEWNTKYPKGYGPKYFKQYMAMVNGVDEQFGRIINELDSLGLAEDTLVMFFSDHGTCMGSHGEPSKNVGFEEAMRTPMMFRWKNHIKPKIDDILFSAPDIFPTMLSLMGFRNIIPDRVEGTDFSKTVLGIEGDIKPTSQFYTFIPYGGQSYGRRGIRTDKYMLVIERKVGKPLDYKLFNLKLDPYQQTNIADENQELIKELIDTELMYWLEHTGDPWRPTMIPSHTIDSYI